MAYTMDITLLCKSFFTLGTIVAIGGTSVPSFRRKFMNYGSRATKTVGRAGELANHPESNLGAMLDLMASLQVPHTWFTHFYVVSMASSIFWAVQILTHGKVLGFIISHHRMSGVSGMTINQVFLAWGFMALQGARRLYESMVLTKPSQSKMWIGHWIIGSTFYIFIGISVWIEGISALDMGESPILLLEISKPSMKTFIAVPVFLVASGIQHDCHVYLASLKKYTLPDQQLFRVVICPHYACEFFIYLAIAIVAAPKGQVLNSTVLSGIGFVVSNLGVTADSTKKWYADKFGAEKLAGRWRMLPYIY